MRIINSDNLKNHGNQEGREKIIEIMEAGLQAADPYYNTLKMLKVDDGKLYVGYPDFVPIGSPRTGIDVYDLAKDLDRIFVFGAGKGLQRVVKAIEDILGDYLTGGHIILKHGDEAVLEKVGVTYGGHPIPDRHCVEGCLAIIDKINEIQLTERDLVFTVVGNGVSSLLTMPPSGLEIEDVMEVTRIMQIEKGLSTMKVNIVRNQVDRLKGGRITRLLHPAKMVHIITIDLNEPNFFGLTGYKAYTTTNFWLHTLPDMSNTQEAIEILRDNDIWEKMPAAIREHLMKSTFEPELDVLKVAEFERMDCRIFSIMPTKYNFIPVTMKKAEELGYTPHFLTRRLVVEAAPAGALISRIALNVVTDNMPFTAPCVLFLAGELLVTVGDEAGIGGRNQEFALSGATIIKGNKRIVIAAVDTDGTDGPGGRFNEDAWVQGCSNLAGAIVDGYTVKEAAERGVDIMAALRTHGTSDALWQLDSGVWATRNISLQDLILVLVMDHDG